MNSVREVKSDIVRLCMPLRMLLSPVCFILLACGDTAAGEGDRYRVLGLYSMKDENLKLDFACRHNVIPPAPADGDLLFKYGSWLLENNLLQRDGGLYKEVERLYRIAAAHGSIKANVNLQNGALAGYFKLGDYEHLRLSQILIDGAASAGYYYIGIFLLNGTAGLTQDIDIGLGYIRRSADMGHPEAQDYVGERLLDAGISEIGWAIRHCAAQQGVGKAARALGVNLKNKKRYKEAVEVFQLGVMAGDGVSAGSLRDGFRELSPTNELDYLAQELELHRAERYEKIWRMLANYSYANPKVPEINDIVPLPPAPLPDWDGKLQWIEPRLANEPPEKPAEALIKRLAQEKDLDPATGRPLSDGGGRRVLGGDGTCTREEIFAQPHFCSGSPG